MNNGKTGHPCPRCLLSSLPDGEESARAVGAWIDALKAHERASDQTRAARLAVCEQCEYLEQATCALCGCYVDYRAARRMQYCPDLPPRWTAEE